MVIRAGYKADQQWDALKVTRLSGWIRKSPMRFLLGSVGELWSRLEGGRWLLAAWRAERVADGLADPGWDALLLSSSLPESRARCSSETLSARPLLHLQRAGKPSPEPGRSAADCPASGLFPLSVPVC